MAWDRRVTIVLAILLQLKQVMFGVESRMEAQFEYCCGLGSSWAIEGLRCEKFTGPVSKVPQVEQGLCLEAVDICCIRAYHEKQCELGKSNARAGQACTTNSKSGSDYQRDCCEGCKLGILTGSMGQGCAFKSFTFGKPWDPAFLECCYEVAPSTTADSISTTNTISNSTTDTTDSLPTSTSSLSIPTPKLDDICQLMKGMLCSDICVPTPGSYVCACHEGFTLLEDGKTCRSNLPVDRCKTNNPCEHRCVDTGEAIVCTCKDGYELAKDEHSCTLKSTSTTPSKYDNELLPKCPAGYRYNATSQVCDDIDECAENLHSCGDEICYNQPGGYSCAKAPTPVPRKPANHCGPGLKYTRTGCVDINECQDTEDACSSNEQCTNTVGSFVCTCKIGFRRDNLTQACVDINECQLQENDCLPTQRCDNTLGSYACVRFLPCGTGYTLNAATEICEDDDECVLGTHDCGEGYHCRNTLGSYRCDRNLRISSSTLSKSQGPFTIPFTTTRQPSLVRPITTSGRSRILCPQGFQSNGNQCVDIDECELLTNPCNQMQRCVNTMGSYRCLSRVICGNGYTLDSIGQHCVDVDECAEKTHECGPGQICENRQGGYMCSCPGGHTIGPNKDCVDIDECSIYEGKICSPNSECENTIGSYRCNCKPGFESVGAGGCQDVDECRQTPGLCQHVCLNGWGSYRCACRQGFRLNLDNRSCSDIDECSEFKENNLCIGICENTPGSYACKCPDGYRLGIDGRTCQDIDECAAGPVCRGANEICQNTRGSFHCNRIECPLGYHRDHERKNRCLRTSHFCQSGDLACLRLPSHYSFNFIALVSLLPIPPSGQLELFTMRSTHLPGSVVQFSMAFVDVKSPPGIVRATESCFKLRKPAHSKAVLVLTQSLPGPQEIELNLSMEIYHNSLFAGSAIAKLFIFVSEYEF